MAKTYRLNGMGRAVNRMLVFLIRRGRMPKRMYVLTVRGRKSGTPYSTPVSLIENQDGRYLLSPYGEVSWVKNARAAGQVVLEQGRRAETFSIEELAPREAAPLLKTYITREAITRQYFDVAPDASLEAFEAEAIRHPVFRLIASRP